MNDHKQSAKSLWARVGLATLIIAAILAIIAWICVGPVIAPSLLRDIQGAREEEVRRILGEPSEITSGGQWIYQRRANHGWVAISFDESRRVSSVNDESVFRFDLE